MTNHQNKIEKLIAELCPNGVEFKELGKVCKVLRGKRLTKKELSNEYKYPVFHGGLIPLGCYNKYNRKANKTMVINTGSVGEVVWSPVDFWSSDGTFTIETPNYFNDRFIYFFLKCQEAYLKSQKREGGVPTIDRETVEKIKIPIPPLAIQQDIVKILDTFTTLETELEAELEARKKQYEYYRDEMLTFGDDVEWKTLGEVCYVASGGTPAKAKAEFWENGTIPWLKSESCNNEPVYYATNFITELGLINSNAKLLEKNTTLMALVGATIFKTAFLEFDSTTNQNIASMKSKDISTLNDKFIFFYLTNLYSELKSSMKTYGMLNLTTLKKIEIPIPPLAEQERIVAILDKFDALVNDISVGLPAELNARRMQYEYYRGKLLTFKKFPSSGKESNSPPPEGCQPKDDGVV